MEDRKVVMVVASNREDQFREFVDAWHDQDGFPWDVTILVQDGGGKPFRPKAMPIARRWNGIVIHDWASISEGYNCELPDWLARRDSGIKAWGFLEAVLEHKADVVITLDDDCLPCTLAADPSRFDKGTTHEQMVDIARIGFTEQHLDALYNSRRWTTTIPGFVPRGLPYGTDGTGQQQPRARDNSLGVLPVALNMGVWAVIPDRDAVHELTNWTSKGDYLPWKPTKDIYRHSRVMSPQQYWPLCGMNVAFRREAAPLMYFPRMGYGMPFRRFDDIWCGVMAQKCLRHLGLACSVGRPIINHVKASLPMDNLVRESPGIRANEEFWEIIERIELAPGDDTPLRCMSRVGNGLEEADCEKIRDEHLRGYVPQLGSWIQGWCDQFIKAGWDI